MQNYIISIDLDNTLLNSEKKIPEKTINVIKKIRDNGNIIVLSTARTYHDTLPFSKELDLNFPLITHNGGLVINPFDKSFVALNNIIKKHIIQDIFRSNVQSIHQAFCRKKDKVFTFQNDERLLRLIGVTDEEVIDGRFDFMSALEDTLETIFIVNTDSADEFKKYINDNHPSLQIISWGQDLKFAILEVTNRNSTKLNGIKYIMDYYKIDKEHLIAFGDSITDVDTLKYAKYGYAMINSLKTILDEVKLHTKKDNNHEGVAQILKSLNKRL